MKHKKVFLSMLIVALIASFYGCGQKESAHDTPVNKAIDNTSKIEYAIKKIPLTENISKGSIT